MRKIDLKRLFQDLCAVEYEVLKYINRTQGEAAAPLNCFEAATALSVDNNVIRKALRRLVEANVLIVDGEKFQINARIFKDERLDGEW